MKPKINCNGVTREMTDEEYAQFLKEQKEMEEMMANMPKSPEQIIQEQQTQIDELYLVMADMIGGNI